MFADHFGREPVPVHTGWHLVCGFQKLLLIGPERFDGFAATAAAAHVEGSGDAVPAAQIATGV